MMSPLVRVEYWRRADSSLNSQRAFFRVHVHSLGIGDLEEVDRLRLEFDKLALGQLGASEADGVALVELQRLHHLGVSREALA